MKILDKYLFSQVFWSFLLGLALLIIAWITPELLPKIIRNIVAGHLSIQNGVLIILFELPEVIVKSLPMALLIGGLLTFDRLSKDSEITAMRACGISIYRMFLSILIFSVIIAGTGFAINETIVPPTSLEQERLLHKGKLTSKYFTYVDKSPDQAIKQVVLIEAFDGSQAKNIRLINFTTSSNKSRISDIIAASNAKWHKDHWELFNGIHYNLSESGVYEQTKYFNTAIVASNPNSYNLLTKSLKTAKNMNMLELKNYIKALINSQHMDEAQYYKVRFYQKFSQPFAAVILGIVGIILGLHPPRSSRFVGYTVGIFVVLSYYWFWPVSMTLGNIGTIPPFLAAWLPNILAIIIGMITLRYKDF